jgi:homogentisate 1,2-dioxygenase
MELWHYTRNGFNGSYGFVLRPHETHKLTAVSGPHAPRLLSIFDVKPQDLHDPNALPTTVASTRSGISLAVSARTTPLPFLVRNVEADEVHLVQVGQVTFRTDFGWLAAGPGDFVVIPRAVTYTVIPGTPETRTLIFESPSELRLDTPGPMVMINRPRDVHRPRIEDGMAQDSGPVTILLRSYDGITRIDTDHHPLGAASFIGGEVPVWKVNLADIAQVHWVGSAGAPLHFMRSAAGDIVFYNLSARPNPGRPPIHHNADFDELIYYLNGPGAWGAVRTPGTLTHVPMGFAHKGPTEMVDEGYQALLVECRPTLRFEAEVLGMTRIMDTDLYAARQDNQGASG